MESIHNGIEVKKQKLEDKHPLSQKEMLALIVKCTNFAAVKHKNQKRNNKDQTPYINHPIGKIILLVINIGISSTFNNQ